MHCVTDRDYLSKESFRDVNFDLGCPKFRSQNRKLQLQLDRNYRDRARATRVVARSVAVGVNDVCPSARVTCFYQEHPFATASSHIIRFRIDRLALCREYWYRLVP